jgi:hypothetical protein
MINIFTLLSILILPCLSLNEIKPTLCITCKYFLPYFLNNKYGKCSLFIKNNNNNYNLVNGNFENKIDYYYCSVSRGYDDMCGKEGKLYKKN